MSGLTHLSLRDNVYFEPPSGTIKTPFALQSLAILFYDLPSYQKHYVHIPLELTSSIFSPTITIGHFGFDYVEELEKLDPYVSMIERTAPNLVHLGIRDVSNCIYHFVDEDDDDMDKDYDDIEAGRKWMDKFLSKFEAVKRFDCILEDVKWFVSIASKLEEVTIYGSLADSTFKDSKSVTQHDLTEQKELARYVDELVSFVEGCTNLKTLEMNLVKGKVGFAWEGFRKVIRLSRRKGFKLKWTGTGMFRFFVSFAQHFASLFLELTFTLCYSYGSTQINDQYEQDSQGRLIEM